MKKQKAPMICVLSAFLTSVTFLFVISSAGAAGIDTISPTAAAQIKAILSEKVTRSSTEAKLDSNLLYGMRAIVQSAAGNAQPRPEFVQNFLSANVAADNTVKLTIHAVVTDSLLTAINALGATEVSPFPEYRVVYVRVLITQLLTIAERPEVTFIGLFDPGTTARYILSESELQERRRLYGDIAVGTNVGSVTSQGVVAHAANQVHSMGINGAGVKVCVLSDGVNSLAARQASGDLPAVDVVAGQAGNGDEGTAMLEIIHDMAPGATLGFATGFNGPAQMATNILTLRNAPHNCDIIVDDVSYNLEAPFQDGDIAQAVNTVTAGGALYFSSAANSGSLAKGTSGTWEGDFVNSGTSIGALPESGTIHSFSGSNANTLTAQGSFKSQVLSWSDPMGASINDYDLFILNSTMTSVLAQSANVQNGTQDPQESISGTVIPSGSKIIILNFQGLAITRALRLDTARGRLSIGTNGNTFGHNAAASTITVAAVNVATAGGGVFVGGATNPVETYSSDGPRRIFYTPAGAAITPGNVLFGTGGGTLLNKVDITAADCVSTATDILATFCGTSAAAPHAAAIAALVKSATPGLTPSQIETAMTSTALDIEAAGYDFNAGNGLVMAGAAVRSVLTPNTFSEVPGGGLTPSSPAAVLDGTTLHLVVRGLDNHLYLNSRSGGTFGGWSEVPGGGLTLSQPAAVLDSSGALRLYVQGLNSHLYVNSRTGGSWSGWSEVPGGGLTPSGPEAVLDGSTVRLVVRGLDSRVYTSAP
ncbi:MAG: S8 family serine peptidase [candidate division NC10 bacterium]|nr:S8 family serine peptidase [candidate division NC10 bacterium]